MLAPAVSLSKDDANEAVRLAARCPEEEEPELMRRHAMLGIIHLECDDASGVAQCERLEVRCPLVSLDRLLGPRAHVSRVNGHTRGGLRCDEYRAVGAAENAFGGSTDQEALEEIASVPPQRQDVNVMRGAEIREAFGRATFTRFALDVDACGQHE